MVYFIPIKINHSLQKLVELYIKNIASLHGIPSSIVSNRDPRFRQSLLEVICTKLRLSSTYHPQINDHTKWNIWYFEDLLRACVLEQRGN